MGKIAPKYLPNRKSTSGAKLDNDSNLKLVAGRAVLRNQIKAEAVGSISMPFRVNHVFNGF